MTPLLSFVARSRRLFSIVPLLVLATACAGQKVIKTTADDPNRINVGELWLEPTDLESRNLFQGPGGTTLAPDPSARYEFIRADEAGYSKGYDVRDAQGTQWSVKLGPEAQPEIVTSRVLWALGYHQPPIYLLPAWELVGAQRGTQGIARFRRETPNQQVAGEWSWYQNPFVTTQPFKALVVANLMLNNWDWKTSNNRIYDVTDSDGAHHRFYVVRDLGASLGKTTFPRLLRWTPFRGLGQGSRNDVEGFEQQAFIKGVDGQRVRFDYRGIHQRLVNTLTVDDVVFTARLMSRISDQQWSDAFRAAAYREPDQVRYIAKIKAKIREGLALGLRKQDPVLTRS